jgi:NADH-quinone oxidoreductase subunit J
VTHPKPVYSALYFVLTVFASAGLFVLLWAEFMAAALVLIYAGAILITYVFVIMLASQATGEGTGAADKDGPGAGGGGLAAVTEYDHVSREPVVAAAVGFALMGMLLFVIFDKADAIQKKPQAAMGTGMAEVDSPYRGSTQQIGHYLFNNQLVNLELAGLLLTISMVGAIVIARRRVLSTEPIGASVGKGPGDTQVGPATPISDDPFSIPVYGTDNPRQKAYPET